MSTPHAQSHKPGPAPSQLQLDRPARQDTDNPSASPSHMPVTVSCPAQTPAHCVLQAPVDSSAPCSNSQVLTCIETTSCLFADRPKQPSPFPSCLQSPGRCGPLKLRLDRPVLGRREATSRPWKQPSLLPASRCQGPREKRKVIPGLGYVCTSFSRLHPSGSIKVEALLLSWEFHRLVIITQQPNLLTYLSLLRLPDGLNHRLRDSLLPSLDHYLDR